MPPAHDAGRSDAPPADGKATRDATVDVKTAHDAGVDAKTAHDAGLDAKAAHDAGLDAKATHDAQLPIGGACASSAECTTGFCVDGVCCNAACRGACVSCVLPGSVGTCSPAPADSRDPHALCVDQGPTSCGKSGVCDGIGGCALYPAGTLCAPPSCSGNTLIVPSTCDGAGVCVTGPSLICTPYACVDGACQTECIGPDECVVGTSCIGGSCMGTGSLTGRCSASSECLSGVCAQGVCCASQCDGVCSSCALPGSLGTCTPVPASQRPDGAACP